MNVLIIHRQPEFLQMVKEKFIDGGWRVQTANSGLDGLFMSRHNSFDLILCGFELPVITGTEIVRTIRTHSINKATPAFFISSGNETVAQLNSAEKMNITLMSETMFVEGTQLAWLN